MKIVVLSFFIIFLCTGFLNNPDFVFADDTCYVDEDADDDGDGDSKDPYQEIEEALYKDCDKIILKNGIYKEDIVIGKYVEIVGEDRNDTIIAGRVTMKDNSKINNVTIVDSGVVVSDGASVEIENVKIKDSNVGVETTGDGDLLIKNVFFYDNQQAITIKSGKKIEIVGNEIYNNDKSGIDIKDNVEGEVSDNFIHNNDANGIIVVAGKVDLDIVDNKIEDNESSGVVIKYVPRDDVYTGLRIEDNTISDNNDFGIVCSASGGKNPGEDFWKDIIKITKNKFDGNDGGKFSEDCSSDKNIQENKVVSQSQQINKKPTLTSQQQQAKQQQAQIAREKEIQAAQQKELKLITDKLDKEQLQKESFQDELRNSLQSEKNLQVAVNGISSEVEELYNSDMLAKEMLESRPKIFMFFIGPDYSQLRTMAEDLVIYDEKIKQATEVKSKAKNISVLKQIDNDIESMTQKKEDVLETARHYNELISLFGWFFKKDA